MEAAHLFHDGDDVADFEALLGDIAAVKLSPTGLAPLPADVVDPVMHAAAAPNFDRSMGARYELWEEDYDEEIDENLRKMEAPDAGQRPCPDYLNKMQHGQMDSYTRAVLVQWMDAFTRRYALADGTLHRAVAYVDRFLSAVPLTIIGYQLRLLGAVAVFAAAKYEDRYTTDTLNPSVIASYGELDKDDVVALEAKMLRVLDYRMGGPTAHTFVDHFTRRTGEQSLAYHLVDLTLLDYRNLHFPPSVVAASALFVSRCSLNRMCGLPWNYGLMEQMACTRYATGDLAACIAVMYDMHEAQTCPGYEQMKMNYRMRYSLPDRLEMIQYIFLAA